MLFFLFFVGKYYIDSAHPQGLSLIGANSSQKISMYHFCRVGKGFGWIRRAMKHPTTKIEINTGMLNGMTKPPKLWGAEVNA